MIYLASKSPRRRTLLEQINVDYQCLEIDIDETQQADETAEVYVRRLAMQKARAGQSLLQEENAQFPVLAADTVVLLNNEIMGKPKNKQNATAMLKKLSGQSHQVLTAVALCTEQQIFLELSVTEVSFRELTHQEIELYWQTGEPLGKAGAYAIQGLAGIFISNINGSYSGVMGLPLFETSQLLSKV